MVRESFSRSRWFTRGWTLQELIAPKHLDFFDRDWKRFRDRVSLCDDIALITGIPRSLLVSEQPTSLLQSYPIATKMSWAAGRETTRIEDRAYSLLGLFGVNMGLIYGEGNNAFQRLQKKILKSSIDETIFTWSMCRNGTKCQGLLAPDPDAFQDTETFRCTYRGSEPVSITNRGVTFTVFNRRAIELREETDVLMMPLDCADEYGDTLCVRLQKNSGVWRRSASTSSLTGVYILHEKTPEPSNEWAVTRDIFHVSINAGNDEYTGNEAFWDSKYVPAIALRFDGQAKRYRGRPSDFSLEVQMQIGEFRRHWAQLLCGKS